jgi:hypothetical protein
MDFTFLLSYYRTVIADFNYYSFVTGFESLLPFVNDLNFVAVKGVMSPLFI